MKFCERNGRFFYDFKKHSKWLVSDFFVHLGVSSFFPLVQNLHPAVLTKTIGLVKS